MTQNLHGFRHLSAAEQTAKILTEAIGNGEIVNLLPGEMELSARLKVSRPTLRRAIAILARQDLVVTAKGKRTQVVGQKRRKSPGEASVCFMVYASPHSHLIKVNSLFDEVKATLAIEGVMYHEIYKSQIGDIGMAERLREIVASRKRSCFVLLNAPRVMQQWFAKSGEPVLVMGSCHEGVDLPSIDLDYHAVGWHAGGQFVKNKHKSVLLIVPDGHGAAGLFSTEAGLKEYMDGVADTHVRVLRSSPDSFLDSFERALRGPAAPTAALACRMEMALSVLGAAQRFGRCIPRNFSLIARDDHQVFESMAPQITRYRCNMHTMALKTVRLIHSLLRGVAPSNRTTLVVPDFFAGQTLLPL